MEHFIRETTLSQIVLFWRYASWIVLRQDFARLFNFSPFWHRWLILLLITAQYTIRANGHVVIIPLIQSEVRFDFFDFVAVDDVGIVSIFWYYGFLYKLGFFCHISPNLPLFWARKHIKWSHLSIFARLASCFNAQALPGPTFLLICYTKQLSFGRNPLIWVFLQVAGKSELKRLYSWTCVSGIQRTCILCFRQFDFPFAYLKIWFIGISVILFQTNRYIYIDAGRCQHHTFSLSFGQVIIGIGAPLGEQLLAVSVIHNRLLLAIPKRHWLFLWLRASF